MKSDTEESRTAKENQIDLEVLVAFILLYNRGVLDDVKQLKSIIESDFEIKQRLLLGGTDKELSSDAIKSLQSDDIVTQVIGNINAKISLFEGAIKDMYLMSDGEPSHEMINQQILDKKMFLQELMQKHASTVSQCSLKNGDVDDFMLRK